MARHRCLTATSPIHRQGSRPGRFDTVEVARWIDQRRVRVFRDRPAFWGGREGGRSGGTPET